MTRSLTIKISLALAAATLAAIGATLVTRRTVETVAPSVIARRLTIAYIQSDWDTYWQIAAPDESRAKREQAANLSRARDTEWGVIPARVRSTTVLDTSGAGNMRTVRVLAATDRGPDLFVWRLVHDDEGWRVLSHERNPGGSPEP